MRQPRFFFRIIHFVMEAGLRCGDLGGGVSMAAPPELPVFPHREGSGCSLPSPSLLLRSGVQPSQVVGGSERNCLDRGGGGIGLEVRAIST